MRKNEEEEEKNYGQLQEEKVRKEEKERKNLQKYLWNTLRMNVAQVLWWVSDTMDSSLGIQNKQRLL